jgi:type I restriction enzyme S subunit
VSPVFRLDEVCEVVMGQAPSGETYNTDGKGWPLIAGAGDFGEGKPEAKKFTTAASKLSRVGDVILGIRASIGEKVIADNVYCLGRGVAALRARKELEPRFLWHWLTHTTPRLAAKARGATFKQVNRDDIGELPIELPPLQEQHRIAAMLDNADELRGKRRAALAELDKLTQSIFLGMFGDPATNTRKWRRATLGEVASQKPNNGIFKKNHEYSSETTNTLPVVWVEELFHGDSLDTSSSRRLAATTSEVSKYGLYNGDILFCRSSLKLDGIAYNNVYEGDDKGALFECHIIRLRPDRRLIEPVFLNVLMRTPAMRRIAKSKAKTATMTTIDQKNLSAIQVLLPPLKLQQEFVARFGEIRRLRRQMDKSLAEMKDLFTCLQWHAFHGQLGKAHA